MTRSTLEELTLCSRIFVSLVPSTCKMLWQRCFKMFHSHFATTKSNVILMCSCVLKSLSTHLPLFFILNFLFLSRSSLTLILSCQPDQKHDVIMMSLEHFDLHALCQCMSQFHFYLFHHVQRSSSNLDFSDNVHVG